MREREGRYHRIGGDGSQERTKRLSIQVLFSNVAITGSFG